MQRGDRRAASGADLSQFNFDSRYGREALQKMLRVVVSHDPEPLPSVDMRKVTEGNWLEGLPLKMVHVEIAAVLRSMDLLEDVAKVKVTNFLNRLLGVPVLKQNAVFAYYTAILDADIAQARTTGTYNEGVNDIRGRIVESAPQVSVYTTSRDL
jgi:hypothetical protein